MPLFPLGVRATTYNVVLETRATFSMGPLLYANIPSKAYPA